MKEENILVIGMGAVVGIALMATMFQAFTPVSAAPPGTPTPPSAEETKFNYVSELKQTKFETAPGQTWSLHAVKVEVDIKNVGEAAGVCTAWGQMACAEGDWEWRDFTGITDYFMRQATVQPGETATFFDTVLDSPAYGYT